MKLNENYSSNHGRHLTVLNAANEPRLGPLISLIVLKALGEGYSFLERKVEVASDEMFLEAAASMKWDVALVVLNNISYKNGRRTPEGITVSSLNFLRSFTTLYPKPVIAFYGHASTVPPAAYQMAGAFVALRLPCGPEDVQAAFAEVVAFVARHRRSV